MWNTWKSYQNPDFILNQNNWKRSEFRNQNVLESDRDKGPNQRLIDFSP